ncbi:hypothetical protein D9M68_692700 [compost metagenome]
MALAPALIENLPFSVVATPPVAPFIFTPTPGSGKPSSLAVTVPVIVRSCASAVKDTNMRMNKLCKSFLINKCN